MTDPATHHVDGRRAGQTWLLHFGAVMAVATAAVERWRGAVVALLGLLLIANAAVQANAKPFWHDEIYTLVVAGLPSLRAIWTAELQGLDLSPPLNSIATHGVDALWGTGRIISRLPPIAGFAVMSLAVFSLVRRRSTVVVGLVAALLAVFSGASGYAYEARGNGLMVGLCALAFLSWAEAARGYRRWLYLPLLAMSLSAGVWNHYYAVLVFLPIGVGEAVRLGRERKVDWGLWAMLGVALVGVLPLTPLAEAAGRQSSTYWQRAHVGDIGDAYRFVAGALLGKRFLVLWVATALLTVLGWRSHSRAPRGSFPSHEIAAGLAALLIPVWAVLFGVYVTGVFVPRYAICGVVGLAVVAPLVVWWAGAQPGLTETVLCVGLVAAFAQSTFDTLVHARPRFRDPVAARPLFLAELKADDVVAVTGQFFLESWYCATNGFRNKIVYLADPAAALRVNGSNTLDLGYEALAHWVPVRVEDSRRFLEAHHTFALYSGGWFAWLPETLRAEGASLVPTGAEADARLYRVTAPGHISPTGAIGR